MCAATELSEFWVAIFLGPQWRAQPPAPICSGAFLSSADHCQRAVFNNYDNASNPCLADKPDFCNILFTWCCKWHYLIKNTSRNWKHCTLHMVQSLFNCVSSPKYFSNSRRAGCGSFGIFSHWEKLYFHVNYQGFSQSIIFRNEAQTYQHFFTYEWQQGHWKSGSEPNKIKIKPDVSQLGKLWCNRAKRPEKPQQHLVGTFLLWRVMKGLVDVLLSADCAGINWQSRLKMK